MNAPTTPLLFECQLTTNVASIPFRVSSFRGREEISKCFAFDVELSLPHSDAHEVAQSLLGERADLSVVGVQNHVRHFHGVIRRVEPVTVEGGATEKNRLRIRLAPRLWLLGRGRRFRIFQAMTVPDIVKKIVHEHSIPARFAIASTREPHEYLVQYDESDLAFVERLLAMEGISYAFDHSDEEKGDVVVFSDEPSFLGEVEPSGSIPWRGDAGFAEPDYSVHAFQLTRRIDDGGSAITAFDFRRPLHTMRADATIDPRTHTDARGTRRRHLGTRNPTRLDPALAQLRLDQDRVRVRWGVGASRHPGLLPGARIQLSGVPIAAHDGVHHVVRVEHEHSATADYVYKNRFASVPDGVVYRPKSPRRRPVQVVETAIVVGPAGQEIHVDDLGRIKVRFHWDDTGPTDDHASCWIRTSQTWAGAGWGFQFIPRVGMEVLVAFLGGDVDSPVVIGTVNNQVNPPTFPLPAGKTKSGIRTHSTRNGTGYNELSFEDRTGHEQFLMRAERDMDVTVVHDETHRVGGSLTEHIQQYRFSVVDGNVVATVGGNTVESIGGDATHTVTGTRSETVIGNATERIVGRAESTLEDDFARRILGRSEERVEGSADTIVKGDTTIRTEGSLTFVVGKHDAPRGYQLHVEGALGSYSAGATEIVAHEGLVLRCGESTISLTPEAIELRSPKVLVAGEGAWFALEEKKAKLRADEKVVVVSDDKIAVKASGASVTLTSDAKIGGSSIKLADPDSETLDRDEEEGKITKLELVDDQGQPLAGQRYRIVLEDGSERTGVLDQDGKAEVRIPSGGTVYFPDAGVVEEA